MPGTSFTLEVQPRLPDALRRLKDLANDLLYSWDPNVRRIFARLDEALWEQCGHNPKVFLRRLSPQCMEDALHDRAYMDDFRRVVSGYDTYSVAHIRPEF